MGDEVNGKDSFGSDKRREERERSVDRGEGDRGRHGDSSRGRDDDRRKRDNDNEWDRHRDIYRDRERQRGGNNGSDYNRGTYRSREDRHVEGRGGAFRRQVDPERRDSRLRERKCLPYVGMWARSPSPPPVKKFTTKTRPEKNVDKGQDNKSKKNKARERSPSKSSSYSSSSIISSSSSSGGSGSDTDNDGSDGSSESCRSGNGDKKREKRKTTDSRKKKKIKEKSQKASVSKSNSRPKDNTGKLFSEDVETMEEGVPTSAPNSRSHSIHVRDEVLSKMNEFDRVEAEKFVKDVQGSRVPKEIDSDNEEIGPVPLPQPKDYADNSKISYGGQLMPGEGDAIAQYVQQNMRIPRRGEIGWQGDEIERLENEGYVMSGSRHAKMNAVRLRKENQVYSAEEKRALALITFEEKQQRENKLIGDFRSVLTAKFADADKSRDDDEK